MNLHRIVALAAAALAAAALAAQPADVEVVVTASRIEEPAERAAASVTVITAEELEASGQATLVDALERVAGVHFRSTTGGPAQAEVSMGGFGENSHGRVLVLVDGRRINRPDMAGPNWLQVPVENVERVEVLRGPATVLYGDHAVGGVINIITKKGTEKVAFTASAMGGSWLFNQERLGVSGAAGPVRFALSGERSASDGYRERSAWSSLGGGLNLDADLSDAVEASLRLGYNHTDYELPGSLTEAEWEDDPTQHQPGHTDDEGSDRSLDADFGLRVQARDSLEALLNVTYAFKGLATDVPSNFMPTFADVVLQTLAAMPRVKVVTDVAGALLEATGGVDLYRDTLALERFAEAERDTQTADVEVTRLSAGAYASAGLSIAQSLIIEIGGRYEIARVDAEAALGSTLDQGKTHSGIAGTVSASWLPREGAKVYVKADRVYRYPFVDEQVVYSGFEPDRFFEDLDPETGYGIEAGGKLRLPADVTLSAAARLLDMDGEIGFFDPDGFGPIPWSNENLDETRHLGASAEAGWKAGPLSLAAAYTWQLTTFRSGPNDGNEVPLVPNHEVFGEARFALPAGFEVSANARYVSESYQGGDFANTAKKVPDYLVVGASTTWRPAFVPGELELFAGVENLFDEEYLSYILYTGYYPAPGRSWRVGAFYRY